MTLTLEDVVQLIPLLTTVRTRTDELMQVEGQIESRDWVALKRYDDWAKGILARLEEAKQVLSRPTLRKM